jgi:hypothetical protein
LASRLQLRIDPNTVFGSAPDATASVSKTPTSARSSY